MMNEPRVLELAKLIDLSLLYPTKTDEVVLAGFAGPVPKGIGYSRGVVEA